MRLARLPHAASSSPLTRFQEAIPIEVAVGTFREGRSGVIADRIPLGNAPNIRQPDRPVAALGELVAFDVHELVGRYIVGQLQVCVVTLADTVLVTVVNAIHAQQFRLPR